MKCEMKWERSSGQSSISGNLCVRIYLQSNTLIKASCEGRSSQMLRLPHISFSRRDERGGDVVVWLQSIINRMDIKWSSKHNKLLVVGYHWIWQAKMEKFISGLNCCKCSLRFSFLAHDASGGIIAVGKSHVWLPIITLLITLWSG